MGKKIEYIALDNIDNTIVSICHLNNINKGLQTDSYDSPYGYEVLMHYKGESDELCSIEILDLGKIAKHIDEEDCLPDIGLLDYEDHKNKTLREIYKIIIDKMKE